MHLYPFSQQWLSTCFLQETISPELLKEAATTRQSQAKVTMLELWSVFSEHWLGEFECDLLVASWLYHLESFLILDSLMSAYARRNARLEITLQLCWPRSQNSTISATLFSRMTESNLN